MKFSMVSTYKAGIVTRNQNRSVLLKEIVS